MKIVLDTNVLVSIALRSKALQALRDAWEAERFTVVTSSHLLAEVADVLRRPKLSKYFTSEDITVFLEVIAALGEVVLLTQPHPEFRDPKDRYLLAMLRDSEAEILVTGDAALLELKTFEKKSIVSPTAFLAELATRD